MAVLPVPATYDYRLVVFSVIIATVSSYAALNLIGQINTVRGSTRFAWLGGGAFAVGIGIWSMHYIGMLAYQLPMKVYYHVPTVALSLLAAMFASAIALFEVTRERVTTRDTLVGGVLMGGAIATMHYTGMAAMRLPAMHHYDRGLIPLSIILGVVISSAGLGCLSYFRDEKRGWGTKWLVSLVLGLAIPVVHYTGMAAVSFMPTDTTLDLSACIPASSVVTIGTSVVTFLVLGSAIAMSLVGRLLSTQHLVLDNERKMLRALADNVPDLMYVKDIRGRFIVANIHLLRSFGLHFPEQLIGKTDFDFHPRPLAERFYRDEQMVISTGKPLLNREETAFDPEGNEIHLLTSKVPIRDAGGLIIGLAGIGRDITERKEAEIALREAERKYRSIFDDAIVGIFQSAPGGRLLKANPALAKMFGYASAEEMTADVTNKLGIDPTSQEDLKRLIETMGSFRRFECEASRKDGTKIWIALSARAVVNNGNVSHYEGTVEDITEHKHVHEQLLQAQKLESVGQLAAGIAHEINTPTQYVGDNIRFLKDAFHDLEALLADYDSLLAAVRQGNLTHAAVQQVVKAIEQADAEYLRAEIPKAIDQALEGVSRVAKLVSAVKEFSHPGSKEKTPVDLNHGIESTLTVSRNEWKYVADVETDFDTSLLPVPCLAAEFNQVILNLVVNAAHAIADVVGKGGATKGKITVRTRNCPDWVEIRVQDTGTGIPKEIRTRVFDPFFTTKPVGKGTGQGLAIAHSVIVGQHNGTIHFESEEGKGTTFVVRLPHDGQAFRARATTA